MFFSQGAHDHECPAPVGAAGPRIPGARARLCDSSSGWRSRTPPRRIPPQRSKHLQRTARLLPLQKKDLPVRRRECAADFPHVLADREKSTENRRPRRSTARARSWCPLLHKHNCRNVKKGVMECMQGSAIGQRAPHIPSKWRLADRLTSTSSSAASSSYWSRGRRRGLPLWPRLRTGSETGKGKETAYYNEPRTLINN